jgi:hypothetical protein
MARVVIMVFGVGGADTSEYFSTCKNKKATAAYFVLGLFYFY